MKHLTLVFGIILSLNTFSQCEYRYFAPWEYDNIIEEEWDINNSILYRKYYSTQKDTVELSYVDGCSFVQENMTIDYQDEKVQFFQSYLKYEDCAYLLGKKGDHEIYSRTYTLPTDRYDADLDETVFTKVNKVMIFSHTEDFRKICAITFYEEDVTIHHYIF